MAQSAYKLYSSSASSASNTASFPSPNATFHPFSQWCRFFKHYTPRIIGWTSVLIFILDTGCSLSAIDGRSMQPSLNPDTNKLKKDVVLLEKYVLWSNNWQRGDIVTFRSPFDPAQRHIAKRIVGLENDLVFLDAHSKYGTKRNVSPGGYIKVPKGHCWVEGDNVSHSVDSRTFGPIPMALLTAKATAIVWPPSRIQFLNRDTTRISDRVVAAPPMTLE